MYCAFGGWIFEWPAPLEDINLVSSCLRVRVTKAMTRNWTGIASTGIHWTLDHSLIKLTRNKIVAAVLSLVIKAVVETAACSLQSGLVGGPQLVQNAVDLNYDSRRHCVEVRQVMADGNACFSNVSSSLSVCLRGLLNALAITV